jgi:hypothetical protein
MPQCSKCRSTDVMHVRLTLRTGPVLFHHCRGCEHRWWLDAEAGDRIELPQVLSRVAA